MRRGASRVHISVGTLGSDATISQRDQHAASRWSNAGAGQANDLTRRTRARRRCSPPQGREWLGLFAGWAFLSARVESPTRARVCVRPTLASPSICVNSVCFTLSPAALLLPFRPSKSESCVVPLLSTLLLHLLCIPTNARLRTHSLSHILVIRRILYAACTYYRANAADTKLPAITTHFLSLSRAHSRPPIQYKRAS